MNKKLTIPDVLAMKEKGEKITMLTAYDFPIASMMDRAGVDVILVGDSVGNVVLGYPTTVPVTMEEMVHHTKAVSRAVARAIIVGDMPFLSFQVSAEEAIRNAGRFIKEAGADCVKLEWFPDAPHITKAIVQAGISVMGHIGLTPQTATQLGGFKVQGKDAETAQRLLTQAKALEEAGCFSLVLECIPDLIAEKITKSVSIPTIGIGAGLRCDGQVLVGHDLLGLFERFKPKFVKQYVNLSPLIIKAVQDFCQEVKKGEFPTKEYSFSISKEEAEKLS